MAVVEGEVFLPPLGPGSLKVKVEVDSLFVLVGDGLGLVCALEPGEVLLVEAPALLLELLRSQVLQVRPLAVVEDVEQRVDVEVGKQRRIREVRGRLLRVVVRRGVRISRDVVLGPVVTIMRRDQLS